MPLYPVRVRRSGIIKTSMEDDITCIQITSSTVYYVILLFNGALPAIHGIMVNDELGS